MLDIGYRWQRNAEIEVESIPASPWRSQCYADASVILWTQLKTGGLLIQVAFIYDRFHCSIQ